MLNLKKEFSEIKSFFHILKERKFDNYNKLALRNSSYQFLISLSSKIGSLIFTILMARILLPERMGLYSLALSTIVFFSAFTDFGIGNALISYLSKLKNKKNKFNSYFSFLFKLKLFLLIFVSSLLFFLSYFISNIYYKKPIFYALLAGSFYIIIIGLLGIYESLFRVFNDFKTILKKEIIFQILRLFLIPVTLLFLLKLNNNLLNFWIFIFLTLSYLLSLIYIYTKSKNLPIKSKIFENNFFKKSLSKEEIKNFKSFIIPLSFISLSGIFFGSIDMLMLGRYVSSEFISYYSSALSLIGSITLLISFISTGIFPLLSSLKGKKLNSLFKKSLKYSFLISLFSSFFVLLFSKTIILLIYGKEYLTSYKILNIYTILILISPLIALYESYFISQKRTKILSILLVVSTVVNIFLNFFFIKYGISNFGEIGGVFGACFATIISRTIYLIGLKIKR